MNQQRETLIVVPTARAPYSTDSLATHAYHLTRVLVVGGSFRLAMLVTREMGNSERQDWRRLLSDTSVDLFFLDELPGMSWPVSGTTEIVHRSYDVLEFIKRGDYRNVYFYNRDANGLVAIQAKSAGASLSDVPIVTIVHGAAEVRGGSGCVGEAPVQRSMRAWAERFVCEQADRLLTSGYSMAAWLTSQGWSLPENYQVIFPPHTPTETISRLPTGSRRLIYYGEPGDIDTLTVFLAALERLLENEDPWLEEVVILCELGAGGRDLAGLDLAWNVSERYYDTLRIRLVPCTAADSLRSCYEEAPAPVIVALDPGTPVYRLLDCIELGVPFLCISMQDVADYTGIDSRIEMDPDKLARQLTSLRDNPARFNHPYSGKAVNSNWLRFHDRTVSYTNERTVDPADVPAVSICVAHRDHGEYLADALESLEASDYRKFDVIVVDDGSTDDQSLETLGVLEQRYPHWTFLYTGNRGPGLARNLAVENSRAELVIFLDADNRATPAMVSKLVRALRFTGADCVTSYYKAFSGVEPDNAPIRPLYQSSLLGAAMEPGLLENVFGDTGMIVRRDVFRELSGFSDESRCHEDWEFLAKLCLRGYQLAVLPEPVFWYRHSEASRSRELDHTQRLETQQRVADLYAQEGYDFSGVIHEILVPIYLERVWRSEEGHSGTEFKWAKTLDPLLETIRPGEEPGAIIHRIDHLLARSGGPVTAEKLVDGYYGMSEAVSAPPATARHVSDLLELEDRPFLVQAYRTLLLRDPDAGGLAHYSQLLSRGLATKLELLRQISRSPEGRLKGVILPGLEIQNRND